MKLMKFVSTTFAIAALASSSALAAQWTQGTTGGGFGVNAPYSGSDANSSWVWNYDGSFNCSVSSNQVRVQSTNDFYAIAAASTVNGVRAVSETGSAQSYSYWNWSGSPGTGTSVGIHSVVNVAGWHPNTHDASSQADVYAPVSGTKATAWVETAIQGNAEFWDGTQVGVWTYADRGFVWTFAYAEEENGGTPILSADVSSDNATTSNVVESTDPHPTSISYADAKTDYEISIDETYTSASGLSTILASSLVAFTCSVEVDGIRTGTPTDVPVADGWAMVFIDADVSVTLTF